MKISVPFHNGQTDILALALARADYMKVVDMQEMGKKAREATYVASVSCVGFADDEAVRIEGLTFGELDKIIIKVELGSGVIHVEPGRSGNPNVGTVIAVRHINSISYCKEKKL